MDLDKVVVASADLFIVVVVVVSAAVVARDGGRQEVIHILRLLVRHCGDIRGRHY